MEQNMTSRRSKKQWQEILDQQERSGLSKAAFCRDQNISPKRFYYHSRKQRDKPRSNGPAFVRAEVIPAKSATVHQPLPSINIKYGRSQLLLPPSTPVIWLAELLVALA